MNNAASQSYEKLALRIFQDGTWHKDAVPWVPSFKGKSFRPLGLFTGNRGFVELLRLEPGAEIATHRHTGEVHAFHLEGSRQLSGGEMIGPGDYVYEPPGNVDSWRVVGDVPLVVLILALRATRCLNFRFL
jgi:2,4'-dihydroxyacetophenone dioxygenase